VTEVKHFNLVDEPWIRVRDLSGGTREVSLRELFQQAPALAGITGEIPTQDAVILRILLAVLHRAVDGPLDIGEWADMNADWDSVVEKVDEYLDEYHDRFWLAHPIHPFMQVSELRTAKEDVSDLTKIICDGPGSSAFLTTRLGENLETLTWAEAARWLIHTHAFDMSGIKSGAVGDPRVKGGKGYPIGTGWGGQIGIVHLVADDLKQTLLLNLLVPDYAEMEIDLDADLPVWERSPLTALPTDWDNKGGADQPYRHPSGPIDLYTWPSRRIRLVGTPDGVTGVVLSQGDRATPQNRQSVEPMTAWRYSDPQSKKFGTDVYMPQKHDPAKSFWRGLEALLPKTNSSAKGKNGQSLKLPPALTHWVESLRIEGQLPQLLVRWRTVGMEYGSNESAFDELIIDELVLPTALFDDGNDDLVEQVLAAVESADRAVYALGSFAQNLALAAGASSESSGPRNRVSTVAFAGLDPLFRIWVRGLRSETDLVQARKSWQLTVSQEIETLANELFDEAGPSALVGRDSAGQFRDAGLALHWFRKALRKALPYAVSETMDTDAVTELTTDNEVSE